MESRYLIHLIPKCNFEMPVHNKEHTYEFNFSDLPLIFPVFTPFLYFLPQFLIMSQ